MANKFQFKLFTSSDPQAQYDALVTKDAYTFYLLKNGVGYLGETKLFDASDDDATLVTNMLTDGYTGDNTSAASTKAIVDYVTAKVGSASAVLTTAFFRKVESHTITADDLTNSSISLPEGTVEGEVGLLFTADMDGSDDGDEQYFFISLKDYLKNMYTPENSSSINMSISSDNKIKAELNVKSDETSLKIDEDNGGVYLEKATVINEDAPSAAKLITEDVLVNYIKSVIANTVTYTEDDGTII